MKKIFLIFLILILLVSSGANAQYEDVIRFSSIEYYLMNKIIFKDVYKRNTEIMKMYVKKVTVVDEINNLLTETSIDKEGRVTGFKSYSTNGQPQDINAAYDIKNNLTGIFYKDYDGKAAEEKRFNYIGNTLFSYEYFLQDNELKDIELYEQCDMRYDNAADKSMLTGFDSRLWQGDSIPYAVNFKYDSRSRLIDVRVVQDVVAIYDISYSGDTIKIVSGNGSGYETFIVKENLIRKHIIYSEELSYRGERTFHYNENELVEFVSIEDSRGNKYRQSYVYDYYH